MEQWNRADEDRSENLTLEEVAQVWRPLQLPLPPLTLSRSQLLRKMNVMAKRKWIREQTMKADNSHFSLDATQFLTFMNNLMGNRADVKVLRLSPPSLLCCKCPAPILQPPSSILLPLRLFPSHSTAPSSSSSSPT